MVVLRKGSDKAEIRVTKKEPVKGRSGRGEMQVKKTESAKALGRYKLECSWLNHSSHKSNQGLAVQSRGPWHAEGSREVHWARPGGTLRDK